MRGQDGGRGPARGRDRDVRPLLPPARGGGDGADRRGRDRADRVVARRRRAARAGRRGARAARQGSGAQAQRRAGDQHGDERAEVAAAGEGRHDVPGADGAPGAHAARELGCARAAGADELVRHARTVAGGARPGAGRRPPARLPAEQGAQGPRRRPAAGGVAAEPRPRMVPAGARRPLHGASDLGAARAHARMRLSVGVRVELGQPRRRAGPADPGVDGGRGRTVRRRGRRPDRGRPQGRPPRTASRRRPGTARGRPDAGCRPRRLPGRHPPSVLQHQHPVARPRRAGRRARPARRACSACR